MHHMFWLTLFVSSFHNIETCPQECTCYSSVNIYCSTKNLTKTIVKIDHRIARLSLKLQNDTELTQSHFKKKTELKYLSIFALKIIHIQDKAFSEMLKLEHLKVMATKVKHISKNTFFGLKCLQKLYFIDNTELDDIHQHAFQPISNLQLIRIRGSKINSTRAGSRNKICDIFK